ncbi:hypothetical protein CJO94_12150 [Ralstonia solanacearum]|nr:hypothetical protein CJO94_12150 [Ralstonia solanacearum]
MARAIPLDNPFVEAESVERLRAQAEAVLWVRKQMAQHGLTLADLMTAGCFDVRSRRAGENKPGRAAQYRSADGQSWDGEGEMPDWLRRAINAGQSAEHFRIS